jgi:glycosyltransferase involved in cell wall biosynthesis
VDAVEPMTESVPTAGRVSVVLPFLNAERFLGEAIESVLVQTYLDWELLLVDDGSSDSSAEIALGHAAGDRRIVYVRHPDGRTHGLSASRNLGIARATGEYVAFLDADDLWLAQKLDRQVKMLTEQPEVDMVYGSSLSWYSWSGRSGDADRDYVERIGVPAEAVIQPPSLLLPYFVHQTAAIPNPSSVIVRRRIIERVGGFDDVHAYEDQAFYAKVILVAPVSASTECWDRYRLHEDSITARVDRRGEAESARAAFFDWLMNYLSNQGLADPKIVAALRRERFRYAHPRLSRFFGTRILPSHAWVRHIPGQQS